MQSGRVDPIRCSYEGCHALRDTRSDLPPFLPYVPSSHSYFQFQYRTHYGNHKGTSHSVWAVVTLWVERLVQTTDPPFCSPSLFSFALGSPPLSTFIALPPSNTLRIIHSTCSRQRSSRSTSWWSSEVEVRPSPSHLSTSVASSPRTERVNAQESTADLPFPLAGTLRCWKECS